MSLDRLIAENNVIAVVDNQWGDTGKGKIVDFLAEYVDIIARGNGGANAGHTISINGNNFIFHLIPSGILYDEDKTNVIGSGVAFDPRSALEELKFLDRNNRTYNNLVIAYNAKLVLPQHLLLDKLKGGLNIETTGRGIGPAYVDHVSRIGLVVRDMLNKDIFYKKLKDNLEEHKIRLRNEDSEKIREILQHEHLSNSVFYNEKEIFDIDAIVEKYLEYGEFFKKMIIDTDEFMMDSLGKSKILLEGAQGLLLSLDSGTYPYVTSCDTSIQGLAKGVGLHEQNIDLGLSVTKAFYMTRVGGGSFPTEIKGEEAEVIRKKGNEYGATTGRPRRIGWLDLPLLRYAVKINGPDIGLTKLDVLDEFDEINLCIAYKYQGPDYNLGSDSILRKGDILKVAIPYPEVLDHCEPIYKKFNGWKMNTTGITSYLDLPQNMREIIKNVEEEANVSVKLISNGCDRSQIIFI